MSWRVELDEAKCTLCDVCTKRCPPGALTMGGEGAFQELRFEAALCHGCGGKPICQRDCPEIAIRIVETPRAATGIKALLRGETGRCEGCNRSLPLRKIGAVRGRTAAEGRGEVYRFCPDCRRKRLIGNYPTAPPA